MAVLPAPPEWVFYLSRPTGENVGALIAARSRKLTWFVDSAATCQFAMPGDHPETALVDELAVDVICARNGVNLFRGRVGGSQDTLTAETITSNFTAVDYRGMLGRRLMWNDVTRSFRGQDQANIAWQMIADTQALPGGALGITRGNAPPTGVLRDRDYDPGKNLGEALAQLGQVEGGFEWEIDAARRFNLYYPRRGRQTGLVLTYGRDIVALSRTVNPDGFANAIRFNGSNTTVADELEVAAFDPEIGRWDGQKSDPNLTLQATVDQRAAYELAEASTLTPAFSVTLAAGAWDPNLIWVGDTVRLIIQSGRLDVDASYRIVQIDVTLSDDGGEEVQLSVDAAPAVVTSRLVQYDSRLKNLERALGYVPDVPVGGMFDWPGQQLPQLCMWCDGTVLQQAQYPELYSVLGTTFGSAGAGTFALPDCRGRMVVASGSGIGLSGRATGQTGGAETVTLTVAEQAPPHFHTMSGNTSTNSVDHTHGATGSESANHTHSGRSTVETADHLHSGTTGADTPAHVHNLGWNAPAGQLSGGQYSAVVPGGATPTSTPTSTHAHPFTTGGISQPHQHDLTTGAESATHTHNTAGQSVGHVHAMAGQTNTSTGGTGHENMPPFIAIGKVIKVQSAQNQ